MSKVQDIKFIVKYRWSVGTIGYLIGYLLKKLGVKRSRHTLQLYISGSTS